MSECGTYAGYQQHKKRGEDACAPCIAANRAYAAEYRKKPGKADRNRTYTRARNRAFADLATSYPDEFRTLFEARLREVGLHA